MPDLMVADETYLAVGPDRIAAVVADRRLWAGWWPDLSLVLTRDRGAEGLQWSVAGALTGEMEIWLEPAAQGTVLHWLLRADPMPKLSPRRSAREENRRVRAWKQHAFALKDRLEGIPPGQA